MSAGSREQPALNRVKAVLRGSGQCIEPWEAIQTPPSVVADRTAGSIELGLIPVEPDERPLGTLGRGRRHVCEVAVDPETGEVAIVKYMTLDDVGRVVNPMIVARQGHGGIAQAVGQALMESVHYDPDSGQLFTGSLMDYLVPRVNKFPRIEQHCDQSTPCKINPLGALGFNHLEMPLTAERVWQALQAAKAA